MMTKQPVFPLAETPDVDLDQAGGTNVAGGETFATAERIQRDSTSRAAIASAVDRVRGPSDRDRDRQRLTPVEACDKTVLGRVLEPVRHLGEHSLQLWLGRHKLRGTATRSMPPERSRNRGEQFHAPSPAGTNNATTDSSATGGVVAADVRER
jgi:hypothetical protein